MKETVNLKEEEVSRGKESNQFQEEHQYILQRFEKQKEIYPQCDYGVNGLISTAETNRTFPAATLIIALLFTSFGVDSFTNLRSKEQKEFQVYYNTNRKKITTMKEEMENKCHQIWLNVCAIIHRKGKTLSDTARRFRSKLYFKKSSKVHKRRSLWSLNRKGNTIHRKKIGSHLLAPDLGLDISDETYGVYIDSIEEKPESLLLQPPQGAHSRHVMNERRNRVQSFQRCNGIALEPDRLARAGFFLDRENLIQCYSCLKEWNIFQLPSGDPTNQDWHAGSCPHVLHRQHPSGQNVRREQEVRLGQISSDSPPGIISDDIGDPPGQQSVYIPPGDPRKETYRLSTFRSFPSTCQIPVNSLSKAGFYYTGFYDRVKCFACGRSVERWQGNENPSDLRWHKSDCPLPRGLPCGNVPVNDLFSGLNGIPTQRPVQQALQHGRDEVIQERDAATGAVIRTVRYPADLPDRMRQTGGTFEIGPGNNVVIQSGPARPSNPNISVGNMSSLAPSRAWRMANIISPDHRRYLNNLYLNRELDRLTSFARWPVARPNVSPAALARNGFFYLGDLDRVQCFSCGGVLRNWTLEDDADEEHRTHFPSCQMVQGREPRNCSVPDQPETSEQRVINYPCQYPANPHMRNEGNRLETFDHRWLAGRVQATPAQIAEAGFFYLGERDRVKCWYCNGGLQNWEPNDVPWDEHAKWFPNCQFVLQNKGQVWVHRHLVLNPHLARPIIARQEGSPLDPTTRTGEPMRPADIPPGGARVRQPSPPPTIIDPQVEMRQKKERINNIMKNSEIVKYVLAMGFSGITIRELLEERIDSDRETNPNDIYDSVTSLLDDVMKKGEEIGEEEVDEQPGCSSIGTSIFNSPSVHSASSMETAPYLSKAPGSSDEDMEGNNLYESIEVVSGPAETLVAEKSSKSMQEMLNAIEEERMCKICFSNAANMVYIPCSHMCCCMECTRAIRQCPVCRTKIEKAIKTYLK